MYRQQHCTACTALHAGSPNSIFQCGTTSALIWISGGGLFKLERNRGEFICMPLDVLLF